MNKHNKLGLMLLIALVDIIAAEILIGMYIVNKWTYSSTGGSEADTGTSAAVYAVNRVAEHIF
ncbi:MAG: hypothetical protein MR576_00050 [Firmicutes bacterium]|nr:hypothetical protein [Bacillota bacterium]